MKQGDRLYVYLFIRKPTKKNYQKVTKVGIIGSNVRSVNDTKFPLTKMVATEIKKQEKKENFFRVENVIKKWFFLQVREGI